MRHPATHARAETTLHACWPHKWDPYKQRDEVMFKFDKRITDTLLHVNGWVPGQYECWATGCLDAPEAIPLGGTSCIKTIGGFEREEYMTLRREWESLAQYQRASSKTAAMLKRILDEVDNETQTGEFT